MLFYRSNDLIAWEPVGQFGEDFPQRRGVWECPDLVDLGGHLPPERRWLLVFSIGEGMPSDAPAVFYVFGRLDRRGFSPFETAPFCPAGKAVNTLDSVPDFYAFQSWTIPPEAAGNGAPEASGWRAPAPGSAAPGLPVGIAWANNYAYAHQVVPRKDESNGILTIPRRILAAASDSDTGPVAGRSPDSSRGPGILTLPAVCYDPDGTRSLEAREEHPPKDVNPLEWPAAAHFSWNASPGGPTAPRELVFAEGQRRLLTIRLDYSRRELWYRREEAESSGLEGPGRLSGLGAEKTIVAPVLPGGAGQTEAPRPRMAPEPAHTPPRGAGEEPNDWFDLFIQRGLVELFAFDGRVAVSLRLYPEARRLSLITRA